MSYNKKALLSIVKKLDKAKAPGKPKDVKIINQQGQRKYPGQVTEIQGDTMATDGYGYIPLMVVPNNGQGPQMVMPNTGEHKFNGATSFTEYPVNGQDFYEDDLDEEQIAELRAGGYIVEDISVPSLTQAQKGKSVKPYVTSDIDDFKLRQAAYNDSLWLYNKNLEPLNSKPTIKYNPHWSKNNTSEIKPYLIKKSSSKSDKTTKLKPVSNWDPAIEHFVNTGYAYEGPFITKEQRNSPYYVKGVPANKPTHYDKIESRWKPSYIENPITGTGYHTYMPWEDSNDDIVSKKSIARFKKPVQKVTFKDKNSPTSNNTSTTYTNKYTEKSIDPYAHSKTKVTPKVIGVPPDQNEDPTKKYVGANEEMGYDENGNPISSIEHIYETNKLTRGLKSEPNKNEIVPLTNRKSNEPSKSDFAYRDQAVYEYDKDTKKFNKDSSRKAPLPYAERYSKGWKSNTSKDIPESGPRVWTINGAEYYNQEDANAAANQYEELPSYNFQNGGQKEDEVLDIPEMQAYADPNKRKQQNKLIDKARAIASTIEGRQALKQGNYKDFSIENMKKFIKSATDYKKEAEDYHKARRLVSEEKMDPGSFARRYNEKGWAKFDEATANENYKGEYQQAVDKANKRKGKNMAYTDAVLEFTGAPALQRIAADPIGTAKGVGQTIGDIATLPYGVAEGAYNYATDGNFDMGTNAFGQKYGEGLNETMDALTVLPFVGSIGKGANLAKPALIKGANKLGKALDTETGLLSNAWKYNPWAFKPNSNAYYRMIGKEGYVDALNTGIVRPPQTTRIFDQGSQKYMDIPIAKFDEAYYNAQYPLDKQWYPNSIKKTNPDKALHAKKAGYNGPYMAEVTGDSHLFEKGENVAAYTGPNSSQTVTYSKEHIPITNPNLKFYKKNWLKGYKEVPKKIDGASKKMDIKLLPDAITDWNKKQELLDVPRYSKQLSQDIPMTHVAFEGFSDVNPKQVYFKTKGRSLNYDQALNLIHDTQQQYPVLQNAGNPLYFHGAQSGSLTGIHANQGILPLGDLMDTGYVPFTGELGYGVQGINKNNTSTASIRNLQGAVDYAVGPSGKPRFNTEQSLNEWFTNTRDKYPEHPGTPKKEFYDDLYNKRLTQYQNLTEEERALLDDNFPIVYGINPKSRRFTNVSSDIPDEVGISGKIGYDEIPSMFVPQSRVETVQKYIGDKSKVFPMEDMINNKFFHRAEDKERYLQKWKDLGYKNGGFLPHAQTGIIQGAPTPTGLIQKRPKSIMNMSQADAKKVLAEEKKQKQIALQEKNQPRYQPTAPAVSESTRTGIPNEVVAAIQNAIYMESPEYKAEQEAKKAAQAQFEKEQWAKYNNMTLGEKALDRTNAFLNQGFLMGANALAGEQAYIPGMAAGLDPSSSEYDNYLNATNQTRGLSLNDAVNVFNPGNWGGHAGRQYGEGNYATGAAELGLGLLGARGIPIGTTLAKSAANKLINLEESLNTGLLTNLSKSKNAKQLVGSLKGIPPEGALPRLSPEDLKAYRQVQEIGRLKAKNNNIVEQYEYALKQGLPEEHLQKVFNKSKEEIEREIPLIRPRVERQQALNSSNESINLTRPGRSPIRPIPMEEGNVANTLLNNISTTEELTAMANSLGMSGDDLARFRDTSRYSRDNIIRHSLEDNAVRQHMRESDYWENLARDVDALAPPPDEFILNTQNFRNAVTNYGPSKSLSLPKLDQDKLLNYISEHPYYKERNVLQNVPSLSLEGSGSLKNVSDKVASRSTANIKSGDVFTGSLSTSHSSYLPQLKQVFKYKEGQPQFLGYQPMNSMGYLSNYNYSADDIAKYLNTEIDEQIKRGVIPGNIQRPYIKQVQSTRGQTLIPNSTRNNNKYKKTILLPHYGIKQFEEGGFIDADLTDEEIKQYEKDGYVIEYLP